MCHCAGGEDGGDLAPVEEGRAGGPGVCGERAHGGLVEAVGEGCYAVGEGFGGGERGEGGFAVGGACEDAAGGQGGGEVGEA